MKVRTIIVPTLLIMALAGCTPGAGTPPSASLSASDPASPSSPDPTPAVAEVAIPGNCDALVSIGVVHAQFGADFVSEPFVLHAGDAVAQNFANRDGLSCSWILPRSDGFVTMHVAERETVSDEAQIAAWQAAGLSDCSPFLDACFYKDEETMVGKMWTNYALAGGFEVQVMTSAGSLDQAVALTREAATNMGYN